MLNNLTIKLAALLLVIVCNAQTNNNNNYLQLLPKPTDDNKVKAAIDESFFLSCIPQNGDASPSALRWLSPTGEPIGDDNSLRIYTVPNSKQLNLQFYKLESTDAGVYTCQGVKDGVSVEIKVELVLEQKISFRDTPLEQFIRAGQSGTVTCRAHAIPGPEIKWFRKGYKAQLRNDNKYDITNDGLQIKNVQPEDEGVYFCEASVASTGQIRKADIHVQVMHEPKWTIKPEDTDGVQHEDIVIRCQAFAKPAPTYKWYRNDIQLVGARYITTADSLRITSLTRQDTGTYTCEAENNSGKIQANFRLNVLVGPSIAPIEPVRVIEGDQAKIRCIVREAFPKASIQWKYSDSLEVLNPNLDTNIKIQDDSNQNTLNLDGNLVGSWSELIIERANRDYKRNITCVATNKAQVVERQVSLLVEFKPSLLLNFEAREFYYSWISTDEYGNSGSQSSLATRSYPVVFTCLAAGEPLPQITWYFKNIQIKHDNIKYRLVQDELGLSKMEITPKSIEDFGDYQCKAENRIGKEIRNIQLRQATPPKFAPFLLQQSIKPEVISFQIKQSEAPESDGGLPIESFRIQWRFAGADWSNQFEKEIPVDPKSLDKKEYYVEIASLIPDTEYLFRVAGVNKAGLGVWSVKEIKTKTAPRRQPDPVRVLSKEDCQASTRCYLEWTVDSNGGSPIREFLIRWRRISYKDSSNQHVNTDRIEAWSQTKVVKVPLSNFEILNIQPNSFYEVEILARNDIGPSAAQPFRIRTLPGQIGEFEAFQKRNESKINRVILIAGSILAALVLFIIIDLLLLMKSNCGLFALITRSCNKNKSNSSDYNTKSPPPKIAQHQPKSNTPYQQISQTEEPNPNVSVRNTVLV